MQIRNLKLVNFRNYEKLKIDFSNTFNIIYGNNGAGKTNLVEAIYCLALTKTFKNSNEKVLIKKGQDLAKIEGTIYEKSENNFKLIISLDSKKAKINDNKVTKLSEYISKFNVIVFNPDDLKIIKDSPNTRRKHLNMDISQLENSYIEYLNKYNKILKQRNSYLKTMYTNGNATVEYLDILTKELINNGLKVYEIRKSFFAQINSQLTNYYKKITNIDNLILEYISHFKDLDEEKIFKKFKSFENKDIIFGKTMFGIHHDDYRFMIDDENLRDYGSEGQQKNCIIAYKMCEIDIFYQKNKSYPVLILDDLLSELDNEKIENIFKIINSKIQTFITTTDITKINQDFVSKSRVFFVKNGEIEENTK